MGMPSKLEFIEEQAVFRPRGQVSLHEWVKLIASGIILARDQRISKLLIDTTGTFGFDPPTLGARYFLIHDWAHAARGLVRIAVVAKPELIDPQRFGVTVGANVGLIGDIFTTEEEALTWLRNLK